jgi:hypothetical protein
MHSNRFAIRPQSFVNRFEQKHAKSAKREKRPHALRECHLPGFFLRGLCDLLFKSFSVSLHSALLSEGLEGEGYDLRTLFFGRAINGRASAAQKRGTMNGE